MKNEIRNIVKRIPGSVLLIHWVRRLKSNRQSYWEKRKNLVYYKQVLKLAHKHACWAKSILDVGSFHTPFITQFGWIDDKVSLDKRPGKLKGAHAIQADFLKWKPDKIYDVVLCLQVLEHLKNPTLFARKLLRCGRVVIISVPYLWSKHMYHRHIQDPVNEAKLLRWLGHPWDEQIIVTESSGIQRLIVVLKINSVFKNKNNKSNISN